MAAPTNSGDQSDTEENFDVSIYLNSPSPPPSSNSMVVYQGSGQSSMDNPLQNQQQHEDMVDPPPYNKTGVTFSALKFNVSTSALKGACREHGIKRWLPRNKHEGIVQSLPDEEGIPQLTSDTLPSDQALMDTVDTNSVAEETEPQQFLPTARQENPDEDSGNDEVEAVVMGGVGTGKGGVKIKIPLEEILKYKDMRIVDAAKELKVGLSTLKRLCRDYNIPRWPPRDEHNPIGQSRANVSPAIFDQEGIPQLNSNMPMPTNQVSATIDSVTVWAYYENSTIKFRLSSPWQKVKLEQEVKKKLKLKAGTYCIKYKDEDVRESKWYVLARRAVPACGAL